MFGRFGMIIVLVAVFACTGLLNGNEVIVPELGIFEISGIVIMALALVISVFSEKIAGKLCRNGCERTGVGVRLGALALCGIGAIVVFCG